jgi:hypothetical protein
MTEGAAQKFQRDQIYEDGHRQKWRITAVDGPKKEYPLLAVRLSDGFQTSFSPTGERLAGNGITWILDLKSGRALEGSPE